MNSPLRLSGRSTALWLCTLLVIAFATTGAFGQGASGATLQAAKTVDICDNGDGTFQYLGEVAVWNTGNNDAQGLNINDCLQYKAPGSHTNFVNEACINNLNGSVTTIPGLTQEIQATVFPYSFLSSVFNDSVLDFVNGTIRNTANITIVNHSGGQVQGPTPKATWTGGQPPSCAQQPPSTCELTFGYWKTHSDWPAGGPQPGDTFFNSGLTYQQILDTSDAGGNAYIQLAHQYIAAVLNVENGAVEPNSVSQLISEAYGFFSGFSGSTCSAKDCGLQVTWAALLTDYNQATGTYTYLCSQ